MRAVPSLESVPGQIPAQPWGLLPPCRYRRPGPLHRAAGGVGRVELAEEGRALAVPGPGGPWIHLDGGIHRPRQAPQLTSRTPSSHSAP